MKSIGDPSEILGSEDLPRELVDTNEWWGASVWVRGLTAGERLAWARTGVDDALSQVRLAAMTMIREDGTRLFGDDDVGALAEKSGGALAVVAEAALRLSGLLGEPDEGKDG